MSDMKAASIYRALALFDPLLACAALVVESDDVLGRARQVGDDEAETRIEFARMPFDLGRRPGAASSSSGLIGEVRVESPDIVGRAAERALEHVSDPFLQDAVGRETDRILDALGFEKLVDIRISEAGVGAEVDARDRRDSAPRQASTRSPIHRRCARCRDAGRSVPDSQTG